MPAHCQLRTHVHISERGGHWDVPVVNDSLEDMSLSDDARTLYLNTRQGIVVPFSVEQMDSLTFEDELLVETKDKYQVFTLYLNTADGEDITSRDEYKPCHIALGAKESFTSYSASAQIRGRGNSSFLWYDKKPLRLKLDQKHKVLGLSKAKSWVLLANYRDVTDMMNTFVFEAGEWLGLPFTNHTRYVELFVNGDYRGVYQLTEQVQQNKNRVNVSDERGILLSLDVDDGPEMDPYATDNFTTKVYKMPYGVSLVISPFNFPILLTIGVVAAAMCGGNTVVIKSSSKSAASTAALKRFFAEVFPPEYVTLIDGGHDVADMCLAQRFDKIFYTGSPSVGKHVLAEAAKNLTPVALELGGETGNWAVVRADADLKDTARKIAFFKLTNAGQICININQIAVAEEVAKPFLAELKAAFIAQIGEHAELNPEYPKLITEAAYDKCAKLADEYRDRILFGGKGDRETRRYAPTMIYPVDISEHIVQHELFCPLLPIVPYKDAEIDGLMDVIADREHPLAMYVFTKNMRWAKRVMRTQQFGGGCINEVCIHMMVKGVPFNGTGHSGMGAYHGEWGFREFTHPQTVLTGRTHFNLPLREHPYTGKAGEKKMKLLRLFER